MLSGFWRLACPAQQILLGPLSVRHRIFCFLKKPFKCCRGGFQVVGPVQCETEGWMDFTVFETKNINDKIYINQNHDMATMF